MKVLSLFDGMSCGQLALERAGIPVSQYYASEIDKYAIQITQKNYPNTIQLGDVRAVRQMAEAGVFGHIDLLLGGSPCQGFSFAGKQLAFDDPRSVLFFEYVWILRALQKTNPNIKFILENVKMKKEFLDVITGMLGVDPHLINSNLVSAQNRQRYYWYNWHCDDPADRGLLLKDILEDSPQFEKHVLSEAAIERIKRKKYSKPRILPDKTGTLNTKNNSGQLSFDAGTTLIPLSEKEIAYMNRTVRGGHNHWDFGHHSDTDNDKSAPVVANFSKGVPYNVLIDRTDTGDQPSKNGLIFHGGIEGGKRLEDGKNLSRNYREGYRVYDAAGKAATLTGHTKGGPGGHNGLYYDYGVFRKLTPVECERLQTVPDNYTEGVSNTQRYKCLGNGWTIEVIVHLLGGMPR